MFPASQPASEPNSVSSPQAKPGVIGSIRGAISRALGIQTPAERKQRMEFSIVHERSFLVSNFEAAHAHCPFDTKSFAHALSKMKPAGRDRFRLNGSAATFFAVSFAGDNVGVQVWDLSKSDENFPGGIIHKVAKLHPEDIAVFCTDFGKEGVPTMEGSLAPLDNSKPGVESLAYSLFAVANNRIPFLVLEKAAFASLLDGLDQLDARQESLAATAA